MKPLKCKQLEHLPVVSESQQTVLCPKCNHYFHGQCSNPTRTSERDACPFDGKELPVEEVKPERVRISVEKIMECEQFRREVNHYDLDNIDFTVGGKVIAIPKEYRDDFKFMGLTNWNFITDDFYKEGWSRLLIPDEEKELQALGFQQSDVKENIWNTKEDRDDTQTVVRTVDGFEWSWEDGYGHFKEQKFVEFKDLMDWIKQV